ncbi:hypothetical protein R3P38DRAFT_3346079, partial [Favolaschia claudopus]
MNPRIPDIKKKLDGQAVWITTCPIQKTNGKRTEESRRTALWELLGLRLDMDKKDWKRAEAKRSLGYNGQARSTKYKQAQKERERAAESATARASTQAKSFASFFTPLASAPSPSLPSPPSLPSFPSASSIIPPPTASSIFPSDVPASIPSYSCHSLPPFNDTALQNPPSLYGYFSDEASEPDFSDEWDDENSENEEEEPHPKKKRRKLDVSVREQKQLKKEKRKKDMSDGLTAIEKHLALKRTQFQSPLQQQRGRVVQSTLHLVVRNGRKLMDASAMAAETHGFAAAWGSRLAREWTAEWIESRTLPESDRGRHAKTWSLLNDPEVREELAGYLRTNKWSMKPDKLVEYSKAKLVTDEMKKFVQNEVNEAMPRGLKKYLELELFPRIGYKVARGISVNTARRWLHEQGFQYTEVKKGLYYDGHERPDVVDYRQNEFIPAFDAVRPYLVEYQSDNLELQKDKGSLPPGQYWLVLTAQDEMTAQANDGDKWKWIMQGENPIRKKGVGRGIHRSDVICSTVGHIVDGGEQIEYGKNYDGFWDGPQFIKQLRDRIIPAFEKLHDRNIYRACFLIDNSNGHCAYAVDALLASRMNWRSGGKQAMLRDGWFWKNGLKIVQKMVLPSGEAKGMKLVLEERGLFHSKLKMKCCDQGFFDNLNFLISSSLAGRSSPACLSKLDLSASPTPFALDPFTVYSTNPLAADIELGLDWSALCRAAASSGSIQFSPETYEATFNRSCAPRDHPSGSSASTSQTSVGASALSARVLHARHVHHAEIPELEMPVLQVEQNKLPELRVELLEPPARQVELDNNN